MWESELELACQAAAKAADILRDLFGKTHQVVKKGKIDLVTEADLEAESVILQAIRGRFPDDDLLSEEAGESSRGKSRKWIIDPLDGTTNFAHGFPFFSVSIALEAEGEIVLGVTLDPIARETFRAVRGQGAFLNDRPIRVSQTRELEDALLGTGFPYDVREEPDSVLRHFRDMLLAAQAVRRPGSATLDLCCAACGRFDGYWEARLKPWDMAAGAILVREAGGLVTTYTGEPFTPYSASILAANPHLHRKMAEILKAI